jgi:general secretion pathway protein N
MDVGMNMWRQGFVAAMFCLCASLASAAEEAPRGDAAASQAVMNPVALQPSDQLSATHDRPLFSPTRRPPPKPVAAAEASAPPPPPPAPPPSLVLLGIVSEDGEGRAAIRSRDKDKGKVERVRIGDDVGGWKVDRIEPRRLVLTLGERSVDFALFAAKAAKSADAAAPQPRARQVR